MHELVLLVLLEEGWARRCCDPKKRESNQKGDAMEQVEDGGDARPNLPLSASPPL